MTAHELNEAFGLPGVLAFDEHDGLTRAQVTLPAAKATVYLQGAHLVHWQPSGMAPVLFLSERSEFAAGKPIRGGVPVCFPWFATDTENRAGGKPGPSHGFARLQEWTVAFAALLPGDSHALHLTFTLAPSDLSRTFGFDHFRVAYEMIFGLDEGRKATLRLSVANLGDAPMPFEEALHTYYAVADVHDAAITGLEGATYLDKTDGLKQKKAPGGPLQLTGWTDRVFPGTTATATIHDAGHHRKIVVQKKGSNTTVVWNPWAEASKTIADLAPEAWPGFLCVETANAGANALVLQPREAHTMEAEITVTGA